MKELGAAKFDAFSAGVNPKGTVSPVTLKILSENFRLNASDARSKPHEAPGGEFPGLARPGRFCRAPCRARSSPRQIAGGELSELRVVTLHEFIECPIQILPTGAAEKLLTTVPVRKPNKQDFVRVNPDPAYRQQKASTCNPAVAISCRLFLSRPARCRRDYAVFAPAHLSHGRSRATYSMIATGGSGSNWNRLRQATQEPWL